MEMTELEKAAGEYEQAMLDNADLSVNHEEDNYDAGARDAILEFAAKSFVVGAEWQTKQSPWINVKERSLNGITNKIAYLYGKILSLNGCDLAELDELLDLTSQEGLVCGKLGAKQSPWIRTEDKMPEDEELVLTSSGIYGTKLLVWNDHYKVWDDEDGDDCYCERDKIDAWMPIPE